jgi:hypothetical protein
MLDSDPATDWKTVATVTNSYMAVDPSQHRWSASERIFYRVKMSTADGNTYYSNPQPAWNSLNHHDQTIIREILRRERLLLNRYTGNCGVLLKRRNWGELCNNCRDYDSGDVINQNCPICFGVGIKGGYFPPIEYNIYVVDAGLNKIQRNEVGTDYSQTISGKGFPCPEPRTNDVWIDDDDNRWLIQNMSNQVSYRGFPITLNLELRIVAPTDIIFDIPQNYDGMT